MSFQRRIAALGIRVIPGWPIILHLILLVLGGYWLVYGTVVVLALVFGHLGLSVQEAVTAAAMLGVPLYFIVLMGGWLMRSGLLFYLGYGFAPVLMFLVLELLGS